MFKKNNGQKIFKKEIKLYKKNKSLLNKLIN